MRLQPLTGKPLSILPVSRRLHLPGLCGVTDLAGRGRGFLMRCGSRILRGFDGEKARGSALFWSWGAGVARYDGEPQSSSFCSRRWDTSSGGTSGAPGMSCTRGTRTRIGRRGEDGSRLFYCALGEEALCAKEGRDRGLGSGGCCRKIAHLLIQCCCSSSLG